MSEWEVVVAKGQPFSIRLAEDTERVVEEEARRSARSKSAVVEAFTEETARLRRFPGIAFRGDHPRRRAWVVGTGLDVWEIAQMVEDFGGPEQTVAEAHLTMTQVTTALAYGNAFPDAVEEAVAENRRPPDEPTMYPFVVLAATDGA